MSETIEEKNKRIIELEEKIRHQKWELSKLNKVVERKNKELNALHFIWCSGPCKCQSDPELTEDIVAEMVRNTKRAVTKFNNLQFTNKDFTLRDKNYYFNIMKPRKLYHKILKWVSCLVRY